MKRFFVHILLLALPLLAAGQGSVEGRVSDASSGTALEFVNIGVLGRPVGTVTDQKGRYRLEIRSADSVTLRYSMTGYRTEERRIALRKGQRLTLDIELKPSSTTLDAVEVSDEKTRQSTFTHIETAHIDNTVGPSSGVESLLKLLPDVQSNNELSSQYSVRGGSFDENLVYINGVEVFRPMLIRSGQQEGMSIINPDLVDFILFSPGGFDAAYGDKLSSVLDITYSRPQQFKGKVSASLLGGAATVQGRAGERTSYAVGFRQHSNRYLMGSMDTKGSYSTSYTDLQALLSYRVSDRLDLGLLAVGTRNVYGLVPESQTTTFGGYMEPMVIDIYFDGQEQDRYYTLLGALSADWRPNDDWRILSHVAVQHINESERYDVQSQYWLYQLAMGETAGDTVRFDRGVGTFLEHARNRLTTDIATFDLRANRYAKLGSWNLGLKVQLEQVDDHLREWKWVDSAGYSVPTWMLPLGDSTNYPVPPVLQQFVSSVNSLQTLRAAAYAQRELNFHTRRGSDIKVLLGLRGQMYGAPASRRQDSVPGTHWLLSPRASVNYKPQMKLDMLFRLAAGVYQQAPFYREYRRDDGSLCASLEPQRSYQVTASADWNFRLWDKPFALTADLYYKYLDNLIPYTVDNLRLRYMPDLQAVGYTTGLSLRLNGQLVEGLESWASLSLMKTMQDIDGDGQGWLPRPTDQRLSFKLFLQDNLPDYPWWRMSLTLVYATGTPVNIPFGDIDVSELRLPSYYRIDWGNTVRLSQFERLKNKRLFRVVDDIQLGIEVFNLFNFRNVVSYLWVADIDNLPRRVPNYLTARQLNFKLTVLF